jgi:hypothetical protein
MVGRPFKACIRWPLIHRGAARRDDRSGSFDPALKGRATFIRRSAAEELPVLDTMHTEGNRHLCSQQLS